MPNGVNAIIDRRDRVARWEGESEFHAEGRATTKAMNKILADFAKVDVKKRRLVIHDGIGQSAWINWDKEPGKREEAQIDWELTVWPKGKWEWSRKLSGNINLPVDKKPDLPAQLDVYTANIRWADVVVPARIEVIDERLESHGFTSADGIVIEGTIKEPLGGKPIVGTMRVQRIGRKDGKTAYPDIAVSRSNEAGICVLKNLPAAWVRVVVEAGRDLLPELSGTPDSTTNRNSDAFHSSLARAVSISGRVTDKSGVPVAGVDVRLRDVVVNVESADEYPSPSDGGLITDVDGRFRFDQVPAGTGTVRLRKSGYSMPGRGQSVTLPASGVELLLLESGTTLVGERDSARRQGENEKLR